MPKVTVKLFAALRDAAGTSEVVLDAATLAEVRAQLVARYGDRFAARLARSRAWVDGSDVADHLVFTDDVEVALLPPFAGG